MPYLERDGVHLYYSVHGNGEIPLILTHGFSSTSEMWLGQVPALSKHFKLIIWDMRGHGQTSYPENQRLYDEDHSVADIAMLLNHVCPGKKAVVGGLSLGGYMSLAFYRLYPERVRALLILDSGPGFKSKAAQDAWNKTAFATAAGFEKDGLKQSQGGSLERSSVTHRNAQGLARAARGMLARRYSLVIESLPDVKVPTLLIVGGDDKLFIGPINYMASKIPGAEKVVIPDAGHAVNIDQPEATEKALMEWLTRNVLHGPRAKL